MINKNKNKIHSLEINSRPLASAANDESPTLLLKNRFFDAIEKINLVNAGVFLLATNGEVICSNSLAAQVLFENDGLKADEKNRLSSSNLVDNLRLHRAMAKVSNDEMRRPKRNIEVGRISKPSSYLLDVLPIHQGDVSLGIIAIAVDSDESDEIDTGYIMNLFELAPSELSKSSVG